VLVFASPGTARGHAAEAGAIIRIRRRLLLAQFPFRFAKRAFDCRRDEEILERARVQYRRAGKGALQAVEIDRLARRLQILAFGDSCSRLSQRRLQQERQPIQIAPIVLHRAVTGHHNRRVERPDRRERLDPIAQVGTERERHGSHHDVASENDALTRQIHDEIPARVRPPQEADVDDAVPAL